MLKECTLRGDKIAYSRGNFRKDEGAMSIVSKQPVFPFFFFFFFFVSGIGIIFAGVALGDFCFRIKENQKPRRRVFT